MADFPANPKPSRITLSSVSPNFVSVSHSMRRQVRSQNAQRFSFDVEFAAMTASEYRDLSAFVLCQWGQYQAFNFYPNQKPRGAWSGTPLVNGASQTGRTLNIDGAAASVTGWAKAGDFFKLAGQNKVYMVASDANSNGLGQVALNIEPALITSPADNAAITFNNVPFRVAFTDDTQQIELSPGNIYSYSCSLIEVID